MKVSELITFLQSQPQHLTVVFQCMSENCVLDPATIKIQMLPVARPDGWVANARPGVPLQQYLVLPGN